MKKALIIVVHTFVLCSLQTSAYAQAFLDMPTVNNQPEFLKQSVSLKIQAVQNPQPAIAEARPVQIIERGVEQIPQAVNYSSIYENQYASVDHFYSEPIRPVSPPLFPFRPVFNPSACSPGLLGCPFTPQTRGIVEARVKAYVAANLGG